jgi:hypothetical protein
MLQSCPMISNHKYFKNIKRTLKIQLILGVMAIIIFTISKHGAINSLVSSILGFAIALSGTLVYIKIAFSSGVITHPSVAYTLHKKAMVSRFATNLLLFAIVFLVYKNCDALVLIITYCVTYSAYWFVLTIKRV